MVSIQVSTCQITGIYLIIVSCQSYPCRWWSVYPSHCTVNSWIWYFHNWFYQIQFEWKSERTYILSLFFTSSNPITLLHALHIWLFRNIICYYFVFTKQSFMKRNIIFSDFNAWFCKYFHERHLPYLPINPGTITTTIDGECHPLICQLIWQNISTENVTHMHAPPKQAAFEWAFIYHKLPWNNPFSQWLHSLHFHSCNFSGCCPAIFIIMWSSVK